MLVLSRHEGEEIIIDGTVRIRVLEIVGRQVRLGIEAPREVSVYRKEVYDRIAEANEASSQMRPEVLKSALAGGDGAKTGSGAAALRKGGESTVRAAGVGPQSHGR